MTGGDDDVAMIEGQCVQIYLCSDHKVITYHTERVVVYCTDDEMKHVVRPYKDDNFIS